MDYEKKYKWAVAGFILMALLNGVILITLWTDKPAKRAWNKGDDKESGRNAVHQFMQKELDLSEEQADSMAMMRRRHFREVRSIQKDLSQNRRAYFDSENEANRDSMEEVIADKYLQIEKAMKHHINEMKEVLKPEQQSRFQELIRETILKERPNVRHRRGKVRNR